MQDSLIGNLSFDIVVEIKVGWRYCKGVLEKIGSGRSLVSIGDEAPCQEPLTFLGNRLWDRWMSTTTSNLEKEQKKKRKEKE
jgi:hypothetical protein